MKRNILAISLGLFVFAALIGLLVTARPAHPTQKLSQAEFIQKLQSNLVIKVEVIYTAKGSLTNEVRGTFYQTDAAGRILIQSGKPTELPFIASVHFTDQLQEKLLANPNFTVVQRRW
jgi:hypothetical protein